MNTKEKLEYLWNKYDAERNLFPGNVQMNYIDAHLLELIEKLDERITELERMLTSQHDR